MRGRWAAWGLAGSFAIACQHADFESQGPRCTDHRGLAVVNASGALVLVEDVDAVLEGSLDSVDPAGQVQLTRGSGGWWIVNLSSQVGGIYWLEDGATDPTRVETTGRFVGVVPRGDGDAWAVGGVCHGINSRVHGVGSLHVSPLRRGDSGNWVLGAPVLESEQMCPRHAVAGPSGDPILVVEAARPWSREPLQILRMRGESLEPVGSLPADFPWSPQITASDEGHLVFSMGAARNWHEDVDDGRTRMVRWNADGTVGPEAVTSCGRR